ncbi:MAG: ammonia-forming cytochrome c nitrite reductase subunit c552 [Planctomycetota bacterium]|jgi:predicted CXXCH cytochrome family protein
MKRFWVLLGILGTCGGCAWGLQASSKQPDESAVANKRLNSAPAAGRYVGSQKCLHCHDQHYRGWKSTLHSKMEQPVVLEGPDKTVKGDFSSDAAVLTFGIEDVDMVIGSRFKQRYARKIGDDFYMLPAQWNVKTRQWVKYQPKNDWWAAESIYPAQWNKRPTSRLCEGCHTTGFDIETKEPAERNITCESCHGPGDLHVESEEKADIINPANLGHERANMVCFQCHMSGRPPKGEFEAYAWPVGYSPGDDLKQYWVYAEPTGENAYEMWADGYAHKNRVQGNTFIRSKMYRKGLRCFTCHDAHGSRYRSFTVKSGKNNSLCLTCHGQNAPQAVFDDSLSEHTHHQADSPGSACIECHMPKTGKNAVKWDARDHSFGFVSPLLTIRFGTPNGCNNCHTDETAEWAFKEVVKWKSQ